MELELMLTCGTGWGCGWAADTTESFDQPSEAIALAIAIAVMKPCPKCGGRVAVQLKK